MIRTEVIETAKQLCDFVLDQQRNPESGRIRSPYYYRGMSDSAYRLTTSLSRCCRDKQRALEPIILANFSRYAVIEDPSLKDSVWKQMIVGQHHGLPTRLLDWTHSPLVALHFTGEEADFEQLDKHDAVIWRIDAGEVNRSLPTAYREALAATGTQKFSIEMLSRLAPDPETFDRDMGDSTFLMLEPPSVDSRIINQYSFFSVIPTGMTDIEGFLDAHTEHTVRYIIRKELRWDLQDLLDQFNVNERIMYPGLDGLSRWIERHYYVRLDNRGKDRT